GPRRADAVAGGAGRALRSAVRLRQARGRSKSGAVGRGGAEQVRGRARLAARRLSGIRRCQLALPLTRALEEELGHGLTSLCLARAGGKFERLSGVERVAEFEHR